MKQGRRCRKRLSRFLSSAGSYSVKVLGLKAVGVLAGEDSSLLEDALQLAQKVRNQDFEAILHTRVACDTEFSPEQ